MPTFLRILLSSLFLSVTAFTQDNSSRPSNAAATRTETAGNQSAPPTGFGSTDPSYRLNNGDTLYISIGTRSNPLETSAAPTIGKQGDVRLPWLREDEIPLAGKTVREAERFLEKLYKEQKMLNNPVVSVRVSGYFLREVYVLGEVRSPGAIPFPPDTVSLDIAEVITKAGGFTPLAKAKDVIVTHKDANGKETIVPVDLESLINSKRKGGKDRAEFPIYPGDRIQVPQTFF
ncbi:MAG: polysaccharide biosynthesis/export family protein [Opitutaceae bacterium]